MKNSLLIIAVLIIVCSCIKEPGIEKPLRFGISKGVYDNKIELRWETSESPMSIEIYRAKTKSGEFELLGTTDNNFYEDSTEIVAQRTYYYKIRVYNSKDELSYFCKVDSGYVSEKYQLVKTFGDLNSPYSIDFDSKNNIYVSDAEVGTVKKFDQAGNFIVDLIHLPGTIIRGIKVLDTDEIVVAESNKGMVALFNQKGVLLSERTVAQTTMLREIAVDDKSAIYVVDMENKYIVKLDSIKYPVKRDTITTKWQPTHLLGSFNHPNGLAYCDTSMVVGGSDGDGFVEFFSRKGKFIRGFELNDPIMYIAKDKDSNLYFASFDRVIKTDLRGKVLATIGLGYFVSAMTVNVNSAGDVFIVDEKKSKIVSVFRKMD
ncbi:MAG TPA: hypothetical protein VGK10_07045 [Prolixibacteraceae bacterium]|jgi:DNA-binding beta-propeller fold protein YncE